MNINLTTEVAKALAVTLRQFLKEKDIDVNHSLALEGIAKLYGFKDWNGLAARLKKEGL